MNRIILPVKPSLVEWRRLIGVPVAVVNWSIEAVTAADIPPELGVTAGSDGAWAVRSVELPLGIWTYDAIVSAIIRAEYPADRVEAIMANAALASISTTPPEAVQAAEAEMAAFQAHRALAKSIARQALTLHPPM